MVTPANRFSFLMIAIACLLPAVKAHSEEAAESDVTLNPEFWLWLDSYMQDDGEIFDPLDFAIIGELEDRQSPDNSQNLPPEKAPNDSKPMEATE